MMKHISNIFSSASSSSQQSSLIASVRSLAKRLPAVSSGSSTQSAQQCLESLLAQIDFNKTRVVLIGEESHGTEEFYRLRADLTKLLIEHHGFNIVATESDWPDMFRVNRYVRPDIAKSSSQNTIIDNNANQALDSFTRFPRWMWRNHAVVEFVEWLRAYNEQQQQLALTVTPVGIYGLDIYALQKSREEVLEYLKQRDFEAYEDAKKHYGCFARFGKRIEDTYSFSNKFKQCESGVIDVLTKMMTRQAEYMQKDADLLPANSSAAAASREDGYFFAERNAALVRSAEEYYRKMMYPNHVTWNIRDQAMVENLVRLMEFREKNHQTTSRAVVWAHNSHLGDASYTEMGQMGEVNVGQLCREHFGEDKVFNIGFSTYRGTVTAADSWDEDPEFMKVNEAMQDSYERLFHDVVQKHKDEFPEGNMYMVFRPKAAAADKEEELAGKQLKESNMLERAIGVIYKPNTERQSHMFEAEIAKQFDAVIHLDTTSALVPLEKHPQWVKGKDRHDRAKEHIPETYPFAT